MAHLYRIVLLFAMLGAFCTSANATFGPTSSCSSPAPYSEASCTTYRNDYGYTFEWTVNPAGSCNWGCMWHGPGFGAGYWQGKVSTAQTSSCPAGSAEDGFGQCACNAGQQQNAANNGCEPVVCVPPQVANSSGICYTPINSCPSAGTDAGWWNGSGESGMHSVCDQETQSNNSSSPHCRVSGFAPMSFGTGPNASYGAQMAYTGDSCSLSGGEGGPNGPKRDTGPQCALPKVAGMVNGVETCYTPAPGGTTTSTTQPKTTTSTNSSGDTTSTTTQSTTNCSLGVCTTTTSHTTTSTPAGGVPGAPVTTTNTTTCSQGPGCSSAAPQTTSTTSTTTTSPPAGGTGSSSGGSSSTTTTTTTGTTGGNGSGSSGSGNGTGSGGGGNCKGNNCGDGPDSAFAGACGAPPACAGDAIECAVAAATFSTNCVLTQQPLTDDSLVASYKSEAIKPQGDQTAVDATTVNIGSMTFDQSSGLSGGSAGVSDLSVTVMSKTVSLPFSMLNVWFERLGVVLRAVALLICARILIRG